MEILLTGSTGFLGRKIKESLSYNFRVSGLARKNAEYNYDISKTIPKFNQEYSIVIHAAGKAHVFPKSKIEELEFYYFNVVGTLNLLKALSISGIPKYFVFISSVSVYGNVSGISIDENSPLMASEPYGKSKIEAELIILDWCKKNNVICTILRLPLIVGSNPPGNLGALIKGIQKGYYFNIAGGMARKSMVLAEDVANSIINVAKIGGTYNLTDGYHPSFLEISDYISFQLGKKKPSNLPLWLAKIFAIFGNFIGKYAPLNSNKLNKIISDLTFDDNKARKAFDWNPKSVLNGLNLNE